MANHRVKSALKHPPAWAGALFFLIVSLAAGYFFEVGPIIWVVAVGGAVGILMAGRSNKTRS